MAPDSLMPESGRRPGWSLPGSMALRLALVAALVVVACGTLSGWLVARASGQEALRRVVSQQTDEVEVVARLLASKIEQSQKVLRTVAEGITADMLESTVSLEWLLRQGLPAVQLFDSMQVVRWDGELRVNLQNGHFDKATNLDPVERDYLRRTLADAKPMVSELIAGRTSEARVMFTMPLHRGDGSVMGVIAGGLRLQSQSLLPATLAQPLSGDSRLVVFTRDGTILSHSDPARIMGNVRDEPGLAGVYRAWLAQDEPVLGTATTQVLAAHIVSVAGMPLPQWMVARVSDAQAVMGPLHGAQRKAWWMAAAGIALSAAVVAALVLWLALPLARLRDRAQLLGAPAHGEPEPERAWPEAGGEVGSLAQALERLQRQCAQHEAAQRWASGQLQVLLDHAPIGILVTREGVLQAVGRQAGLMLGYAPGALEGQPVRVLYASDADCAQAQARAQGGFAAHGSFVGEVCFMRKDTSVFWARVQGHGVAGDSEGQGGGTLWLLEERSGVRAARQHSDWAVAHDPLTQLPNRLGCEQRLQRLLAAPADAASPDCGVLLYLDLDHFTVVNDVAGHDAGDAVLCHVAQLLQAQVRQSGWVARLGGDKFAVVLPGCSAAHAAAVAEQLRAVVQAWEPVYQERSFTLGVSIGMVVLGHGGPPDVAAVLHAADMACYDAKRAGRNQVVLHVAPQAA